jgi:hypothetical protein
VTGIDDHSRFCVLARLLERATARPVCDALRAALARHGAPQAILTDNGKVFTARFGPGPGPVLFDRVCHDNGIRHLLTAPYSPTTTGKIERLHKTMRREFFDRHLFDTIEQAQAALDAWVAHDNTTRPHQGIGDRPPADRFALAPRRSWRSPSRPRPARPSQPLTGQPGCWRSPGGWLTAAASAWPGCGISPAGGWLVSWSRSPCTTGWSRSPIVGCWSPPTPAGTARAPSQRSAGHRWPGHRGRPPAG